MDLKETYNKIANDWFKDHLNDQWWGRGSEKFCSFLSPGASILDIGCGAGIKSKFFLEKGFKVTGIDFSEKMIEIAKREVPGVDFFVGDIYDLDSYPEKFDAVFAQAVLLHVPKEKILDVMLKLKNKLNPNGVLYIGVKEVKNNIEHETVKENDYGYDYERFFSYFTMPEIRDYIEKTGLKMLWDDVSSSGRTNWIQAVARRG